MTTVRRVGSFCKELLGFNSMPCRHTDVGKNNTPLGKKTLEKIGLKSTRSGAGEQFLPQDSLARAHKRGVFFSQTPVCPYICTSEALVQAKETNNLKQQKTTKV